MTKKAHQLTFVPRIETEQECESYKRFLQVLVEHLGGPVLGRRPVKNTIRYMVRLARKVGIKKIDLLEMLRKLKDRHPTTWATLFCTMRRGFWDFDREFEDLKALSYMKDGEVGLVEYSNGTATISGPLAKSIYELLKQEGIYQGPAVICIWHWEPGFLKPELHPS